MYSQSTLQATSAADSAAAAGVALTMVAMAIILIIVTYVLQAIFLGMIFKKAGVESWIAWVPIYNSWKMLELGGQPGYWSIIMLVPFIGIVGLVYFYIAQYYIAIRFGKDPMFVLLAIFLPIVWIIWLAVDKTAVWQNQAQQPLQPTTY